jgi:hypothetical protein
VLIAAALTTWGISRLLTQRRARRVEAEA